jgi:tetratricopeptide (TPR) repeat protein
MSARLLVKSIPIMVVATIYVVLEATVCGQGFGASKMEVYLNRKRPPEVYIMDTAISVRVGSQVGEGSTLARQMQTELESRLCSYDRRLRPEPANPETLISCTITRLDTNERSESRKVTVNKKVGEQQVWNEQKKKYETKPIYRDVEETWQYKILSGELNVSYQVRDKTGRNLDFGNLTGRYPTREFRDGTGAPSLDGVSQEMMRTIINQITPRLVPTIEKVEVWLAKGKLEDVSRLGESGQWNIMLERLETMQPLKKPQDDAYRIYNIGVAYEALAYRAEDLKTTRELLEKAASHYGRAFEMKPDEKYFLREPQGRGGYSPQDRIQTAIANYKKLEEQELAYQQHQQALAQAKAEEQRRAEQQRQQQQTTKLPDQQGGKGVTPPPPPSKNTSGEPLTNQGVIDLRKKGLGDENLIATINGARAVQFDLSPQGLSHLLDNGISDKVITAMRARQSALRRAPPRPPAKKKPEK